MEQSSDQNGVVLSLELIELDLYHLLEHVLVYELQVEGVVLEVLEQLLVELFLVCRLRQLDQLVLEVLPDNRVLLYLLAKAGGNLQMQGVLELQQLAKRPRVELGAREQLVKLINLVEIPSVELPLEDVYDGAVEALLRVVHVVHGPAGELEDVRVEDAVHLECERDVVVEQVGEHLPGHHRALRAHVRRVVHELLDGHVLVLEQEAHQLDLLEDEGLHQLARGPQDALLELLVQLEHEQAVLLGQRHDRVR